MQKKIKELFTNKVVDAAFIFWVPKKGDPISLSFNMCGHDMIDLAKDITALGKAQIKEEKLLDKKIKK